MDNYAAKLQEQPWCGENSKIIYQTLRDFFRQQYSFYQQYPARVKDKSIPLRYCIALSGGPDSLALLTGAAYCRKYEHIPLELSALIINHNLQAQAAAMAEHAQCQAEKLDIPARIIEVAVQPAAGLEADARAARYAALLSNLAGAHLLLGHTLDDQAETMLLALVRGSGANALSGMSVHPDLDYLADSVDNAIPGIAQVGEVSRWTSHHKVFRPLLSVRRRNTWQACHEWGMSAIFDEHNNSSELLRSQLRNQVMPVLAAELGDHLAVNLAKSAELIQADNIALTQITQEKYHLAADGSGGLLCSILDKEFPALRNRVIRYWLLQHGIHAQRVQIEAIGRMIGQAGFSMEVAVPNAEKSVGDQRTGDQRTIVYKCRANDSDGAIILQCAIR